MGFFSKLTADTRESIPAAGAVDESKVKPVYLLQPNGQPPIREDNYLGFGIIGGVNWFYWLTQMNAEQLKLDLSKLTEDEIITIGISIDVGDIYKDEDTGDLWSIFHSAPPALECKHFKGTYAETIPELGAPANELIKSGRLKRMRIMDAANLKYPVKLSHDPEAVYEDLPASEDCPWQGWFYPQEIIKADSLIIPE